MTTPTQEDGITLGQVVTPAGPCEQETIIGIVTGDEIRDGFVHVTWISDQRGVFTCMEWTNDLMIAELNDRVSDSTDPRLDHVSVARHLDSALADWVDSQEST